jgi:hypothetical protein
MKKFFLKILILICCSLIIVIITVFSVVKKIDFTNFPKHAISNSVCFNAKLEHALIDTNFNQCSFLIAGSSMSLNNISGELIQKQLQKKVYNISSWGTRPSQTIELLESKVIGDQVKYVLVAFNNFDFGKTDYSLDYRSVEKFMLGNNFDKAWLFFEKAHILDICSDWEFRNKFSNIDNEYASLKFDKTGSVLLNREGFKISKKRWAKYFDTTGFYNFKKSMLKLDSLCITKNRNLILVYLPSRSDLLTEKNRTANNSVAENLKTEFKSKFIDLSSIKINANNYCDGIHLFKEGAEIVTYSILDSLYKNNKIIPN